MKRIWIVAALVAAAAFPYARTLGHDLVWDDRYVVADVRAAQERGGVAAVAAAPFLAAQNAQASYYRPVVHLSFLLDGWVGGGRAWSHHATNLVLHVVATLLVFALAVTLLGDRLAAASGAALFAVLPVHVESVAFASGRTDLFAAVFTLAALIAWRRARSEEDPIRRRLLWTLAIAACVAGCLSKEVVFLLPVLVAGWSALLAGGRPARDGAAFLPGIAIALAVRALAIGAPSGGTVASSLLVAEPLLAAKALLSMLRRLVVPWPHNALITREYADFGVATVATALGLLVLFALPLRVRGIPVARLAGLFALIFLVPAVAIPANSIVVVAERYLYLPSVGLALLAGAGFAAARKLRPRVAAAAGLAVVVALGAACHARAGVWRDDATLAADFVRSSPAAAYAWDLLGQSKLAREAWEEALVAFDRAVQLAPGDAGYHNDAGIALRRLGRPDLAVVAFRKSLEIDPRSSGTRLNLAYACVSLGDFACVDEQRRELGSTDPEGLRDLDAVLAGGRQRRTR